MGYNSREQAALARFEMEQDPPVLMEEIEEKQPQGFIRTMYKRVDRKIRPANVPLQDGIKPEGKSGITDKQDF